jgi:hypothetical protein
MAGCRREVIRVEVSSIRVGNPQVVISDGQMLCSSEVY